MKSPKEFKEKKKHKNNMMKYAGTLSDETVNLWRKVIKESRMSKQIPKFFLDKKEYNPPKTTRDYLHA